MERKRWKRTAGLLQLACVGTLLGAPAAAQAGGTGLVTGTVRLGGPAPARAPLPVFKNKEVCGETVPDERLVVGPGGGLRYAVITIDGVHGGKKVERDATLVLNNLACRFQPHVQVAEVGQWLVIRNGDPILHNADARLGKETLFNVGLPPEREVRKPLARPGLVAFTCDVRHTWMSAWLVVADHPYHTVTDAYGAYEIRDVPPGHYTARVWHEELGTLEQPIEVQADHTTTFDITYPEPEEKEPHR